MNINDMSDEQKSVLLARLVWREYCPRNGVFLYHGDDYSGFPLWSYPHEDTLYHEGCMALARLVLIWANVNMETLDQDIQRDVAYSFTFDVDGQRWALDKILSLAIDAGLVEAA